MMWDTGMIRTRDAVCIRVPLVDREAGVGDKLRLAG